MDEEISTNLPKRYKTRIQIGINPDIIKQVKHRLGVYEMRLAANKEYQAIIYFNAIIELVLNESEKRFTLSEEDVDSFRRNYFSDSVCGYCGESKGYVLPSFMQLRPVGQPVREGKVERTYISGFRFMSLNGGQRDITWLPLGRWIALKDRVCYRMFPVVSKIETDLMRQILAISPDPYDPDEDTVEEELSVLYK